MKWKAQLLALCIAATATALTACGDEGGTDVLDADTTLPDGSLLPPPDAAAPDAEPDEVDAALPDASPPDAEPDAMLGPETCDNTTDDNGDALVDCDDPLCTTAFFCQAPACNDGEQRVFFRAADLPKLITGGATTTSTIAVPSTVLGSVVNAAAKVSIGHSYVTDIVIRLTNPEGTTAELSSNNGSVGHNYVNTVFSDEGPASVINGSAPFTGVYRPEQPMTRFDSQAAAGNWRMDVVESFDDTNNNLDNGGFAAFELMLCVCTDCEVGPACSDTLDNDTDGMTDCADPDCSGNVRCVPETACNDTLDNDLDGQIDCRDSQCNGRNNCQFATEIACGDDFDNDGDGQKDCFDPDCQITPLCMRETDCRDGTDDDADTFIDCRDPGCLALEPTCQVTETSCTDGFDNDGDTMTDCLDPNCVNTVQCAVPACAAGETTLTVAATDLPIAIPDTNTTGITSTINVATTGTVRRVIVTMSLVHTFDGDLDVGLMMPGQAAPGISLANRVGSSGDNFTETIFSDAAGTLVSAGSAPFTGPFRPMGMLSTANGTPLAGAWKLFARDNAATDVGSLTAFSLTFCYTP